MIFFLKNTSSVPFLLDFFCVRLALIQLYLSRMLFCNYLGLPFNSVWYAMKDLLKRSWELGCGLSCRGKRSPTPRTCLQNAAELESRIYNTKHSFRSRFPMYCISNIHLSRHIVFLYTIISWIEPKYISAWSIYQFIQIWNFQKEVHILKKKHQAPFSVGYTYF